MTPPQIQLLIDSQIIENSREFITGQRLNSVLTVMNAGLATIYQAGALTVSIGATPVTGGADTQILYNNAGTLGGYAISGTGTVVAMTASPVFTTPTLGVAVGTSLTLGGATLGANALAVTGAVAVTGVITATGDIQTSDNLVLNTNAGTIYLGAANDTLITRAAANVVGVHGLQISGKTTATVLALVDGNQTDSTLLGPDGLSIIPFGSYKGFSYVSTPITATHTGNAIVGFTSALTTVGSGAFGPATADVASLHSVTKSSYLTSIVEGEIDGSYSVVTQGKKGDASAFLGAAYKVRTGAGDTGAVLGGELAFTWLNSSGVVQQEVHTTLAFGEAATGVSGGQGFGVRSDIFKATTFAFGWADTNTGTTPGTDDWKWVLGATNLRTLANQYFGIRGGVVSGVQAKGDIVQGVSGTNSHTLRSAATGLWSITNDADTGDLLTLTNNATVPRDGVGRTIAYITGGSSGTAGSAIVFKNANFNLGYLGTEAIWAGSGGNLGIQTIAGANLNLYIGNTHNFTFNTAGNFDAVSASVSGNILGASGTLFIWNSDLTLSRNSAGLAQLGTGATANASGSLLLTNLTAVGLVTVPGAASPVLTTTAAITSGAGVQAGTLTNAPKAGNPTVWVPFVNNGVTTWFPGWTL